MTNALFDLTRTLTAPLFRVDTMPWQALDHLEAFIAERGPSLGSDYEELVPGVWVGRGTVVDPLAALRGPAVIGRNCEIRPGAYIRAGVWVGDGCVLGNSAEFKNCILFDGCQVPHFNYVGDSILGAGVHFGAGATASNFKAGGGDISLWWDGQRVSTGRNKLGVLAGDGADVGCHAVLNPGTVLGRGSVVYPQVCIRGTVPAGVIAKASDPAAWTRKR